MQRRVFITSLVIVLCVVGWGAYKLFSTKSAMYDTQRILVVVRSTGEVKEITDRDIIRRIVDVVVHNERDGLEGIILQPYTYSLEFFTEDTGFGPLLCYRDLGICRFEQDTMGRYIEVPDEFFRWIEEGLKEQPSK
ncbi:hypothetical protein KVG29_06825 [Caldicoprobacter algeriensis]|nr:hypothetical protein [Caldicoprobacter algeriensis]